MELSVCVFGQDHLLHVSYIKMRQLDGKHLNTVVI